MRLAGATSACGGAPVEEVGVRTCASGGCTAGPIALLTFFSSCSSTMRL